MKRIMITSSGFLRKPMREEIIKLLPTERPLKVAYIPTASKVVKDDSYAKKDVAILNDLGITVDEIDIAEVQGSELEQRLRNNNFIYAQGGNPYWILKHVKESGFDKIVPQLIEEGMLYVGKSAGAYVLAPEVIIPSWFPNNWRTFGLTDVTAMGVVPFIWKAHFDPANTEELEAIKRGKETSKYPVRVITNDQGFLITDDEVKFVGIGEEFKID